MNLWKFRRKRAWWLELQNHNFSNY